jgi:hypothetical protein
LPTVCTVVSIGAANGAAAVAAAAAAGAGVPLLPLVARCVNDGDDGGGILLLLLLLLLLLNGARFTGPLPDAGNFDSLVADDGADDVSDEPDAFGV